MTEKIKIVFLNQANEGMASELEIDANQRIDDFLYEKLGEDCNLADFKIRMDGAIVTRTAIISADARIVVSPANIKGA